MLPDSRAARISKNEGARNAIRYFLNFLTCLILGACTSFASADTRLVEAKGDFKSVQDRAHLYMSGPITEQDLAAVERLISDATEKSYFRLFSGAKRPVVFLNSPGGNLVAAIRIGRILRKHAAWTWVDRTAECASACVFILAGGVERNIVPGARVMLHRPYFDRRLFADLSPDDAQALYRKLADASRAYLKDMGMPDELFERMLRVSSQRAELLKAKDLDALRLDGRDPAFEKWSRANAERSLGEDRFRQIEGLSDCLNSGTAQAICESRWKLKLGK